MRILLDRGYSRDEFLEARKGRIGASDIAAIAGLSRFRTPLQVWMEKTGRTEPFQGNDHTRLGILLEPYVADLFSSRTGMELHAPEQVWLHDEFDWAIATPDRVTQNDSVQIKTTSRSEGWSEDSCPDEVALQVQYECEVGNLAGGYAVAMVGGDPRRLYYPYLERNRDIGRQLLEMAARFLTLVRDDTPPAAMPADLELLESLGDPSKSVQRVELPAEAEALFREYDLQKHIRDTAEQAMAEAKARLVQMAGPNKLGVYGDRQAGWKPFKRASYTVAAIDKLTAVVK